MTWVKISTTSFTAQSSVSVNNCFSSAYTHYMIWRDLSGSVTNQGIGIRLRASGSDASGSNYRRQYIYVSSNVKIPSRSTGATEFAEALGLTEDTAIGFNITKISNPFQAARTTVWGDHPYDADGNIELSRMVWSHDLTTSYDGISIFPSSGTMTGTITVYGLRES